jgi:hypothetical protein
MQNLRAWGYLQLAQGCAFVWVRYREIPPSGTRLLKIEGEIVANVYLLFKMFIYGVLLLCCPVWLEVNKPTAHG